ncbi:MAG: hypothetical protein ACI837_001708 [Crocinitomicaceae bacterium]|jgi:hypothetical protein
MRNVLALIIFAATFSAYGQPETSETTTNPSIEEKVTKEMDYLSQTVDLREDQFVKIHALIEGYYLSGQKISLDESSTDDAKRQERVMLHKAHLVSILAELDDDQIEVLKAVKANKGKWSEPVPVQGEHVNSEQ